MKRYRISCFLLSVLLLQGIPFSGCLSRGESNEIDLRAMSAVAAKYAVSDATVEQAVREFFRAAGHEDYAEGIIVNAPPEARISLVLEEAKSELVLRYISELAGCYPAKFWNSGAPVFTVEFKPITMIDDSSLMTHLRSFSLTRQGAERLGITKGMTSDQIGNVLVAYGLWYLSDDKYAAWWNPKTEILAIRTPHGDTLAGAIVHLANEGFRLVKEGE